MKRPRMILFDYGGTLINESDFSFREGEKAVFQHVIRNPRGLSPEMVSDYETDFFRSLRPVRDLGYEPHEFQMLRLKYEMNEIELDISLEDAEQILWDHTAPLSENSCMPGIRECLRALKAQDIRTAVISNLGWSGNALRKRILKMFPDHPFEFILASSDYGIRKPDPRLFALALIKAKLPAEDVWFVGDTFDTDIIGAHDAGMYPVLYTGTMEKGPERSEMLPDADFPYLAVRSYDELLGFIRLST